MVTAAGRCRRLPASDQAAIRLPNYLRRVVEIDLGQGKRTVVPYCPGVPRRLIRGLQMECSGALATARALALTVPGWWSQNRFTMLRGPRRGHLV